MILTPRRKLMFLLPWATAVCIIAIGSLINFHQHKIWHHALMPQIIAHKKDVEYTATDIVLAKIQLDKELYKIHFPALRGTVETPYPVDSFINPFTFEPDTGQRIDLPPLSDSSGLRAPPMV